MQLVGIQIYNSNNNYYVNFFFHHKFILRDLRCCTLAILNERTPSTKTYNNDIIYNKYTFGLSIIVFWLKYKILVLIQWLCNLFVMTEGHKNLCCDLLLFTNISCWSWLDPFSLWHDLFGTKWQAVSQFMPDTTQDSLIVNKKPTDKYYIFH